MALYFFARPKPKPRVLAEVGQVQSTVTQQADSLRVIVQWQLSAPQEADSLRVEVRVDSMNASVARVQIRSGLRREDTLYVPAPVPGSSTDGMSCVAAQH